MLICRFFFFFFFWAQTFPFPILKRGILLRSQSGHCDRYTMYLVVQHHKHYRSVGGLTNKHAYGKRTANKLVDEKWPEERKAAEKMSKCTCLPLKELVLNVIKTEKLYLFAFCSLFHSFSKWLGMLLLILFNFKYTIVQINGSHFFPTLIWFFFFQVENSSRRHSFPLSLNLMCGTAIERERERAANRFFIRMK